MIKRRTIDEVFDTAKIEEVAGDFLSMKRRGSNLIALCPFHNEKTPSFMVSPGKNIYKCFGCGRGGGPVQFVMEHEKFTYPEAIRFLAKRYGIEIEETEVSTEQRERYEEAESLYIANEFAQKHFVHNLHATAEGRSIGLSYFKERGFLDATIKKFGLGYATKESTSLKNDALEAGFTEDRLKEIGLVSQKGFDFFRERVVFPIHSVSGKVIAFGARTLKQGTRDPKYLNSPESQVYNKRKVLYGLHHAKNAIRRTDRCFLVEGYTDVISLFQAGIENVVASSGTALTSEQVKLVKRFTTNITVLYDGDNAGVKAAMRGLDIMLQENMDVRLVLLPDGNDPDSLVKSLGSSATEEFIAREAKDFILFKTQLLTDESENDPIARTRVTRDIVDSIALIPDAIKRSHYIRECARQLEIEESILVAEVNSAVEGNLRKQQYQRPRSEVKRDFDMISSRSSPATKPRQERAAPEFPDDNQERAIIRILLDFGHIELNEETGETVSHLVLNQIEDLDSFANPRYSAIIDHYCEQLERLEVPKAEDFLKHEDPDIVKLVTDFMIPDEYSVNWKDKKNMPLNTQRPYEENYLKDIEDSIIRFKLAKLEHTLTALKHQISTLSEQGEKEELDRELKVLLDFKKQKSELEKRIHTIGIRLGG